MAPRLPAHRLSALLVLLVAAGCRKAPQATVAAADTVAVSASARYWNSATVYFLLTDRFQNGDPGNDHALGRKHDGALLRNFEGGDLAGVTRQIEAGYFDSLGVDAIWLTPFVEQVHGSVDEGTGTTYGYHGYWTRDWTAVDPALGTRETLRTMVQAAHRHGIRVLMDAVLNHPGPVTPQDPAWPEEWVRTTPQCKYSDYGSTVGCTLVPTLPDMRTERDSAVTLPAVLTDKWKQEGRYEAEVASLDSFFRRTGYPRAPRYYLIKWLTDWVRGCGFDGYRVDTAKHFGESVSAELKLEASRAYDEWRTTHPGEALDSLPFYMVGEVYGYAPEQGRQFPFSDHESVDYFAHGYDALINFAFKGDATWPLDSLFRGYAGFLAGPLRGVSLLNYLASHDDGGPYDRERANPMGSAVRLLLAPGGAQIYYGDETARPLVVPGAEGDANLRGLMNWSDLAAGGKAAESLAYWRKLGRFRHAHPAIGAGAHRQLQESPYVFSRVLTDGARADRVVIGLDQPAGSKRIPVGDAFAEGTAVVDAFSGTAATVSGGAVTLDTPASTVLLEAKP